MGQATSSLSPPTLERVFALQNLVIGEYEKALPELYGFISFAYSCTNLDVSDADWQAIPVNSRACFNLYEADVFSTLVNATRMALQGCETDAYALLRVVNEELGIFNDLVQQSLYSEMRAELEGRAMKGKRFSDVLKKKLTTTKDANRKRAHGDLSNFGSHASPTRIALSVAHQGTHRRIKVGMMLENPNAAVCLYVTAQHLLYALRVFNEYFQKNLPAGVSSPLAQGLAVAEERFNHLAMP